MALKSLPAGVPAAPRTWIGLLVIASAIGVLVYAVDAPSLVPVLIAVAGFVLGATLVARPAR